VLEMIGKSEACRGASQGRQLGALDLIGESSRAEARPLRVLQQFRKTDVQETVLHRVVRLVANARGFTDAEHAATP
jgi:hypothetical protein